MSAAPIFAAARYWEKRYAADGRLWGDGPSELARLAVARLRPALAAAHDAHATSFTLIDVGCGYGRDSRYLATELGCRVLGLDPSPAAVAEARKAPRPGLDVEYEVGDVASLTDGAEQAGRFDVAFAANVYHLLSPGGRRELAAALATLVRPGGLLFLSTLSPRDPRHYAVGEPVPGEERSWVEQVYLHFCTADELTADFAAFIVLDVEERSYDEYNASGVVHRHASWFLEGRRR
ncbi:MAG: class I SAM-dependent methyltransferase [Actinobacteria bacterium]|nr:class I SAM-dependent methyltransferase [Actinomycetota bacterium]